MKSVILSMDGLNFSKRVILKELSLYFMEPQTSRHYIFKKPDDLWLTHADRQTESFVKNVLGGLGVDEFTDGSQDYYCHVALISSLHSHRVYVVGNVAEKFVTSIIPYAEVIDLQSISSFTYTKSLRSASCGIHHSNPRYCALAKLWYIKQFIDNNYYVMD